MMKYTSILIKYIFMTIVVCNPILVQSCTNILVTPDASQDGNPMIAYNADSGNLMGMLYHYPATRKSFHSMGDENKDDESTKLMRKVYSWDTGVYLGEIPEADITYNVIGNTNEHGLIIAETTFGGLKLIEQYKQKDAILDYGSLIYITLQRTKTAKEAIEMMVHLMDMYGYASEGESFSIADRMGDVWIMEVIGRATNFKGYGRKGAVWVARRIPNGYVVAHSNQARIQTFPRDDNENCLYSDDVVEMAKMMGIYQSNDNDPEDLLFSFSDVYNPVTFMTARASEARTWSIFSSIAEDCDDGNQTISFQNKYSNYISGKDLSNRMPLWVKPKKTLSLQDIIQIMSNHYENSILSFQNDVGAGSNKTPYRARPLTWSHGDKTYFNERAIATQQTGWNFIGEIRMNMPIPFTSVLWFAVDDSSTSPRVPIYGCSIDVSKAYSGKGPQDGVPSPLLEWDMTKAFWVQNMVSNLVYTRWDDAYPIVQDKIMNIYSDFKSRLKAVDKQLLEMLSEISDDSEQDDERRYSNITIQSSSTMIQAIDLATKFSVSIADELHMTWIQFYGELFARFRDYYTVTKDDTNPVCQCKVSELGYSDDWKELIVKETGSRYECINEKVTKDDDDDDESYSSSLSRVRSTKNEDKFLRGALLDSDDEIRIE